MDRQEGGGGVSHSSFSSGYSSSLDSITSDMVRDDDKDDDSLQDTACSSKVTRMIDRCMKSMVTMDAKEMSTPQLATAAVQQVINGGNNNEKQLQVCNDLRRRGLCLVPLSTLIDYLG